MPDRPLRLPLAIVLALSLAACGADETPSTASRDSALATLTVAPAALPDARHRDGVVQAVHEAMLAAQTGGRVASIAVDVGDAVAAGDVLLRLTDVEQRGGRQQAEAALAAARAEQQDAEANHARIADLAARQLVARSQLDQATARRDAARAGLAAAQGALAAATEQLGYTVVRAPQGGRVTRRLVEPGETVGPGQPLLAIAALDALRVEVPVSPDDARAIAAKPLARVRLDDGREVEASAVTVFPAADPRTQVTLVRVELPALSPAPRPGQGVGVVFLVGEAAAIQVPVAALVRRGEIRGVYVVSESGRIGLRQLRLGRVSGDQVEVLAGLSAGERVVLDPVAAAAAQRAAREATDA